MNTFKNIGTYRVLRAHEKKMSLCQSCGCCCPNMRYKHLNCRLPIANLGEPFTNNSTKQYTSSAVISSIPILTFFLGRPRPVYGVSLSNKNRKTTPLPSPHP